jgi:hypothetical protein
MLRSILTDAQTSKAEHHSSGMNAAGGVSHFVSQVDLERLPEVTLARAISPEAPLLLTCR